LTSSDQVVGTACAVGEQSARLGVLPVFEHRGYSMWKSERHDSLTHAEQKSVGDEQDRRCPFLYNACEG
jgi:hypothetical protein